MDCAMLGGGCLVPRVWEEEKGVVVAMLGDVSLMLDVGCWMLDVEEGRRHHRPEAGGCRGAVRLGTPVVWGIQVPLSGTSLF